MPYLPETMPKARVLITVKTYPLPTNDHGEVVCTAGLLESGKWVRIYPIPSNVYDNKKHPKYGWVELDLIKHPTDRRLESYMPRNGLNEPMKLIGKLGTDDYWAARKEFVYREVFTSMEDLISLYKSEDRSLGTLKPVKIIDFIIDPTERDWKPQRLAKLKQLGLFELDDSGQGQYKKPIRKVPYDFKYSFFQKGISSPESYQYMIGKLVPCFGNRWCTQTVMKMQPMSLFVIDILTSLLHKRIFCCF